MSWPSDWRPSVSVDVCVGPLVTGGARRWAVHRAGLLAILLAIPAVAADPPYQLELFTTTAHHRPLHHETIGSDVHLTVYYLDGLARLNTTLSHQLPAHPVEAQAIAAARLGALTAQQQAQLRASATGLLAARRYGLQSTPAMVINGTAVAYGVTDPAHALRVYHAWRARVQP